MLKKKYCKIHGNSLDSESTCGCNEDPIFRSDRERLIFIYGIVTGIIGSVILWASIMDAIYKSTLFK
jgi:hypothetical protein